MSSRDMEDIDEEEEERLLQMQLQAELGEEEKDEKGKGPETSKAKSKSKRKDGPMTPESEAQENTGVPARIRAERLATGEVQLLVQWKTHPDEKDWTWETENELAKSVPKLVKMWRAKKAKEDADTEAVIEDVVEKIMGKKKWKGEYHYLVKWEGYEKVEDRTWEPCERLKVDVPEIVEAWESGRKARR